MTKPITVNAIPPWNHVQSLSVRRHLNIIINTTQFPLIKNSLTLKTSTSKYDQQRPVRRNIIDIITTTTRRKERSNPPSTAKNSKKFRSKRTSLKLCKLKIGNDITQISMKVIAIMNMMQRIKLNVLALYSNNRSITMIYV